MEFSMILKRNFKKLSRLIELFAKFVTIIKY